MERLREPALRAIAGVRWIPDWGQARIQGMIENRPDWCISRQRAWGVPIPLFVHRQTGEAHPDTERLIEDVARRVEKQGIDAWFELPPRELLGAEADNYDKVSDTLDVWFDSGVTHSCVLQRRPELPFPADLYLEGSDQHRGWFQSSLLTSVAMRGEAPYRSVLTHGFTVDAKGRKMSKSLGNVIAPQKVIKVMGADILRLWVAATEYRAEMSISDEILTRMADSYRRIRNTTRYFLASLSGFDTSAPLPVKDLLALDQWALARAHELQKEVLEAYEQFQFHVIYQKLHQFCVVDMGGFYLDILKDRMYTMPTNSRGRRSAQTAMFHILQALVRWLAPVLSFTAEEIWRYMPGKRGESVFLENWHVLPALPDGAVDRAFWGEVISVRQAVARELEKLRVAGGIGSGLDAEVDIYCDASWRQRLQRLGNELRFVFITSYARVHPLSEKTADAVETEIKGLAVKVAPSAFSKCIRCWHHREDVGANQDHPQICERCVQNVTGAGETRSHA
jgi:isoleucyl-tRNA synthetase